MQSNSCGATLAPGASCTVQIVFTPSALYDRPGQLTITSDASNATMSVPLDGAGVTSAALTISPTSLTFANTAMGSISAMQSITVTNSGGSTAELGTLSVTTDYQLTSGCGATLAVNASCVVQVAFAPTVTGARDGLLVIPANVAGGEVTAALNGTGVGAASTTGVLTFSPASASFGSVVVGSNSSAQTIVVTNTGAAAAVLGTPSLLGDYTFQSGGSCTTGLSLAPGETCTFAVEFVPTATGDRPGLLIVPGSITGTNATAALDGTGVAAGAMSFSTSLLSFGQVALGQSSASMSITLSNAGGSYLTLEAPTISSTEYSVASSTCGGILDAGASCVLSIVFTPGGAGDRQATLTASANGGAIEAQATLDGSGVTPVQLAFTPATLNFSGVVEGQTSPGQSATLTNSGGLTAQLGLPVVVGNYAIASNSCGVTLAPAASCTVNVTFSPTSTGSLGGSVTVSASNADASAVLALAGTGDAPSALVLTPTSLTFLATSVGVTSSVQNITVANTGAGTVTLQTIGITGDFQIAVNTCNAVSLQPQYSCTLSIAFTPTAGGARIGVLTVSDGLETHTVTLSGTGLSAATDTLSPTALTFAAQVVGTHSAAQSVTLSNSGGLTLSAIQVGVSGPFSVANNCGTILGGGLTCSIAVTYTPTAVGAQTGLLTVNDSIQTQTVTLNGTGILTTTTGPSATATPGSLSFGPYATGATTAAQTVTVTNNGSVQLEGFAAATGTGAFAIGTNSCGSALDVGASCSIGISFSPSQPGNAADTLTLTSPSLASPLTVGLSGSGEAFTMAVVGSSTDTITAGQPAMYQLAVTPVGSSAGSVSLSCTGEPAGSTCTLNPGTPMLAGGASVPVAVTITTTAASSSIRRRGRALWASGAGLAWLLPCLVLGRGARRLWLALMLSAGLILAPTACGVHVSGVSGGGTTSPGTSTIVVTASYPGAQPAPSVTLTLIVQ